MSYKVLIVDDSKLARMAVIKVLMALHPQWSRIEASNADEALQMMSDLRPEIALLDFNMPGRDGLDLAGHIARSNPGVQVAVISANSQQEIVERTRDVGAYFIAKPMTQEKLAAFLAIAVERLKSEKA